LFFKLCKRVLDLPISAETGMTRNGIPLNQPVTEAINHPVGDVTQALMNVWFSRIPNDNDRLPQDIEPLFTSLCDIRIDRFCHGRVLLASRLIALFRVDPEWTERNLLQLFDWIAYPSEAKGVWEGFLWSPRPYPPLMVAIKSQFLECTRHYDELGQHREQFAGFLTFAALQPTDGFTYEEFRVAFDSLPKEGLEACARVLVQALDSAADQREENWKNRVQPFWHYVWPKSHELVTPQIVESLCSASPETGISCRLG
jgi:hypothetical protein